MTICSVGAKLFYTGRYTSRHDEANGHFSPFFECT